MKYRILIESDVRHKQDFNAKKSTRITIVPIIRKRTLGGSPPA